MAPAESIRIALRALGANVARSALTVLGVGIGVASVILLVSIGLGVRDSVRRQIEGLGSNLVFVFPGTFDHGGPFIFGGMTKRFGLDDAQQLRDRLQGVAAVVPIVRTPAAARNRRLTTPITIAAATSDAAEVFTGRLVGGRTYRADEVDSAARVCTIASGVRDRLFPNQDPVGKSLEVSGQRFTVIGYYAPQGGSLTGSEDGQVYMPVTTAQRLLGISAVDYIAVKARDPRDIGRIQEDVKRLMAPRYGDGFTVFTQEQTLGVLNSAIATLTAMLGSIAAISLVVGGIGIMNIMLVSVSERTREIGIRKAVGALGGDILGQFVVEAAVLSALGGTLGVAAGLGSAAGLATTVPTRPTWWAVGIAFMCAVMVGVFFGAYPAMKASRLEPMEALKRE